ncbi:unnamed protein product [Meloidogyne enterolobii]|uniref:Uncharacterized protein n=1 Tax=Meloidogyne enterolobii TaxID=390850 RepID=A0ACB0YI97_MELEN
MSEYYQKVAESNPDDYYLDREKLFEWLYEDYVQALDSEIIEERNCGIASSAIILNILWLDDYFPEDLQDFWKQIYRPILLLYVDKLKQNKIEIIQNYLHKFLSMLLKLNYFIKQIYETRDKDKDVKKDILNEVVCIRAGFSSASAFRFFGLFRQKYITYFFLKFFLKFFPATRKNEKIWPLSLKNSKNFCFSAEKEEIC